MMNKVKIFECITRSGLASELEAFLANNEIVSMEYALTNGKLSTIYSALVVYKELPERRSSLQELRAVGYLKVITYTKFLVYSSAYGLEPISNYNLNLPEGVELPEELKNKRVVAISPTGAEDYYFYKHPEHASCNGGLPKPRFAFEHNGVYFEYMEGEEC